jgi:hypothetical protein
MHHPRGTQGATHKIQTTGTTPIAMIGMTPPLKTLSVVLITVPPPTKVARKEIVNTPVPEPTLLTIAHPFMSLIALPAVAPPQR